MRASFVFSEVVNGLRRNVTMTIAMILTTAISLAALGGGLLAVNMADRTEQMFSDQLEVAVFLTEDVSQNDADCSQSVCQQLHSQLEQASAVETVKFESQKEAYEHFKELFSTNPQLVELARQQAMPASLRVKLKSPEMFPQLQAQFAEQPGVDSVIYQKKYVEDLLGLVNTVRNVGFSLALVQLIAAVMLIGNTIQLSAFSRRTEVGIMRLVGATRWYTQLPFLLEAAISGFIGAVLGAIGLGLCKVLFFDKLFHAQFQSGVLPSLTIGDVVMVSPLLAIIGVAIASVTGYVTLRLYVRI